MEYLRASTVICVLASSFLAFGCSRSKFDETGAADGRTIEGANPPACDEDNGGITLPNGFCALVVANSVGSARHLAVRENGDVYVALRKPEEGGGIAALHDSDADGRADRVAYFGRGSGTGIHVRGAFLYFGADTYIERYRLDRGQLIPSGEPESVVAGFPDQRGHRAKPFEFDESGHLYVNVGAPSNACQDPPRTLEVAGLDPCPILEKHAGVWRFDADSTGQSYAGAGYRYATGIRNGVANAWNPFTNKLYVAQHGRDQLSTLWPALYTDSLSAELPSEELFEVDDGDDFGWPYCYYDHIQGKKLLGPEYGGDGSEVGRCSGTEDPILAFPGHWAPNDLIFYDGDQFPERYREGAFIAFHGSWNRAPLEQRGYNVVFAPFSDGKPAGGYEVFADGFAGADPIAAPGDARHRPMGLAIGPEGSLYISDSVNGKIWRVMHR